MGILSHTLTKLTLSILVLVSTGRNGDMRIEQIRTVQSAPAVDCKEVSSRDITPTVPVIFGDLDKNRNNFWERNEVNRFNSITSKWKELDSDGNNRVSRNEFNDYVNEIGPILLTRQQVRSLIVPETGSGCST